MKNENLQIILDQLKFQVIVEGAEYFVEDVSVDKNNPYLVYVTCSASAQLEPEPIDIEFNEVATPAEPKKRSRKAAGRSTRR